MAVFGEVDGAYSHVAKWVPPGIWKSKLGRGHDIDHVSLHVLESDLYGRVAVIRRRKTSGPALSTEVMSEATNNTESS